MDYRFGLMSNNYDNYYTGYCQKCETTCGWEPNHEDHDDIIQVLRNNVIVFGNRKYFSPYQQRGTHKKDVVSKHEYYDIVGDK
jgi:hypothetical protein